MQIKQLILLLGASMLSIASFAQEKKGVESPILSLQQKAAIALPHSFGLTDTTAQTATEPLLNASALAPTSSAVLPTIKADAKGWFALNEAKPKVRTLQIYTAQLSCTNFSKGTFRLYGTRPTAIYLDGVLLDKALKGAATDTAALITAPLALIPGSHQLEIRCLSQPSDSARQAFRLTLEQPSESAPIQTNIQQKKLLSLAYMMSGNSLSRVRLSPSGKYALVIYYSQRERKTEYFGRLMHADGRLIRESKELVYANWLPESDQLHFVRTEGSKRLLVVQSPEGASEKILLRDLPQGEYRFSPDAKTIYLAKEVKGDAKDEKVIRMRDPNDRMPSWRDATQWIAIDLATGVQSPLTSGKENIGLLDIAPSGKLLFARYTTEWTKQPYDFSDLYQFDPTTGKVDTLLRRFVDLHEARYVPGHPDYLLIRSSPNAFDGVGKELPKEQVANSFEGEIFIYSLSSGKVQTPTLHFDPSAEGGSFDKEGNYYFVAENGSRRHIYRLDMKKVAVQPLPVAEDYVTNLSVAYNTGDYWYFGQSATTADVLYAVYKGKARKIWDLDAEKMADYERPIIKEFVYTTPEGTPIEGWYYLPPNFDPSKKYPMLIYYYGGTSPISRRLEGTYSLAMYAAQGYVVYTLNPSGTTGYGQEFSARHLNAWGEPTATEIIAATREFCQKHPFVDAKKIGCFGASYGGFMTQYLQTKGDTFAAAVSHAGISSISNYWGSGYWGVGYNATAAEGNYPWTRKDIYVDRSPLFNADKIHTPLLLLHGDSDTNVPTSESVNLYNALKVLGREVELIEFTGQDHFILEPERREKWTASIQAWFARFLKDDASWWHQLYDEKK